MKKLTHTDSSGKAIMVDIGNKKKQDRKARAAGHINLAPSTIKLIIGNNISKGDVFAVARLAGINAAKKTWELIPLCHNISLTSVKVDLATDDNGVSVTSEAGCIDRTGAEMEALTAVSAALLAVYDMCKSVDSSMVINDIHLIEKVKI
ncbi:MAG TPA: cyclic pyranopterin monophosphate synthase MoaC [Bacteroidales bacterium]|nr:cyclic pyranopterin monophosphate synthase MoaC [Bacteroidales bacterium]HPF03048.1 cyclic pyranopterin monophosphate synthase MoaC [Bacteroidales bacterium]HPJ59858.1 cyclic pyranopterin monophosphate synthase MoaC [Bacteroidales bacterium]HPR12694.1 cyclic pyranopterin monophosphate synthase MoaC [Bacteroidales bacterium]HRW86041.1 cyclic pyranopterin monophosphate synthase MoaC [Bacteroidales bacterium]